jgi:hypothetical protein
MEAIVANVAQGNERATNARYHGKLRRERPNRRGKPTQRRTACNINRRAVITAAIWGADVPSQAGDRPVFCPC